MQLAFYLGSEFTPLRLQAADTQIPEAVLNPAGICRSSGYQQRCTISRPSHSEIQTAAIPERLETQTGIMELRGRTDGGTEDNCLGNVGKVALIIMINWPYFDPVRLGPQSGRFGCVQGATPR